MSKETWHEANGPRDDKIVWALGAVQAALVNWRIASVIETDAVILDSIEQACYNPLDALDPDELKRAVMILLASRSEHDQAATQTLGRFGAYLKEL